MMKRFLPVSVVLFFVASCGLKKDISETAEVRIPEKFIDSLTAQSVSIPSWKEFFSDQNLIRLIDTALVRNFDLMIAMQRIEAARAGVKRAKGELLPDLNANVGAGTRKYADYTMDGVGNWDTRQSPNLVANPDRMLPDPIPDFYLGLSSSWEIDIWGKLRNRKRAALARFLATEQGKNLIQTALVADVALAYYELMLLNRKVLILEENILLQQQALEMVRVQKITGDVDQLAVDFFEAQLLNSQGIELRTRYAIREVEARLCILLGQFPQPITVTPFNGVLPQLQLLSTGVPSDILKRRPDILQSERELMASRADLRAARLAFFPSLNISGALGWQAFTASLLLETPGSVAYQLLGGLTQPIFNRNALKAQLMQSKAEQKQAYLNYHKTIVGAFTEVYLLTLQSDFVERAYTLKSRETELNRNAVTISRELFVTGKASFLDVITAQRNALNADLELIDVQYERLENRVRLYRSLGGGW
ncbi:MAG: TolC family protein [Flavobacteriales bacterium]